MINRLILGLTSLLFILAGCASSPKVTETHSGFLTDYSKLKESDGNSAAYSAEDYDLKNYGKIIFDPVEVSLSQELLNNSSLDAAQQQDISKYVADELNRKLFAGYIGKGQAP